MSRPSSTRWDGILRVRLKRSNALAGIRTELAAGLMAGVGPGLRNVRRHGCGAEKSVRDFRASGAAVRAFVASGSTIYATRVHAASGAACVARVLMDVLGHSQLSITMDMYSHVMSSALLDAADAMDRALSGGR